MQSNLYKSRHTGREDVHIHQLRKSKTPEMTQVARLSRPRHKHADHLFVNRRVEMGRRTPTAPLRNRMREFFIDNRLVRFIIKMIRWTSFASWEFEFSFPGSLISIFLAPDVPAFEREGNNYKGITDLRLQNSSSQGQNLAWTVIFVRNSLDSGSIQASSGH